MIAAPLTMYAVSAAHMGVGLGALDPYGNDPMSRPSVWAHAWMYMPVVNVGLLLLRRCCLGHL